MGRFLTPTITLSKIKDRAMDKNETTKNPMGSDKVNALVRF